MKNTKITKVTLPVAERMEWEAIGAADFAKGFYFPGQGAEMAAKMKGAKVGEALPYMEAWTRGMNSARAVEAYLSAVKISADDRATA